jgi:uncharacterized LabA/DUF88 family protein
MTPRPSQGGQRSLRGERSRRPAIRAPRPRVSNVPAQPRVSGQSSPTKYEGKQLVEKRVLTKYPDQRVGIFVDVSNMYWSVRRLGGSLNFKALREEAVGERKLIRALAYAVTSGLPEEEKFFSALTKSGFEIKLKQLQVFAGGKKKADWDVGLAMDMVRLAPLIDVAVLVSGDGDYVPVIEYLQNSGHLVEVMAFKEGVSAKLVERADAFIDMSQDQSRFLIR